MRILFLFSFLTVLLISCSITRQKNGVRKISEGLYNVPSNVKMSPNDHAIVKNAITKQHKIKDFSRTYVSVVNPDHNSLGFWACRTKSAIDQCDRDLAYHDDNAVQKISDELITVLDKYVEKGGARKVSEGIYNVSSNVEMSPNDHALVKNAITKQHKITDFSQTYISIENPDHNSLGFVACRTKSAIDQCDRDLAYHDDELAKKMSDELMTVLDKYVKD